MQSYYKYLKKYEYMTQLGELKELADKIYKKAYRNNETVLGLSASYWYSITDKNPLSHILQKCKIGGETIFKILRDKKEVSLKVKGEEKT